jgi:hypothetical protein
MVTDLQITAFILKDQPQMALLQTVISMILEMVQVYVWQVEVTMQ